MLPPLASSAFVEATPCYGTRFWNNLVTGILGTFLFRPDFTVQFREVGTRLSIADEYRRYAAECMALAERVVDSADKSHLVIMAQAFLELAEKRDKLDSVSPP
jgi:hypothetical protein